MATPKIRPVLRKVQVGDALSNPELKVAIEFYTKLSESLDEIACVEGGYDFAGRHARHELERLEMFARNRKDRRLNS